MINIIPLFVKVIIFITEKVKRHDDAFSTNVTYLKINFPTNY